MKEEINKILEMVKEGVISPQQATELIEALNECARQNEKPKKKPFNVEFPWGNVFGSGGFKSLNFSGSKTDLKGSLREAFESLDEAYGDEKTIEEINELVLKAAKRMKNISVHVDADGLEDGAMQDKNIRIIIKSDKGGRSARCECEECDSGKVCVAVVKKKLEEEIKEDGKVIKRQTRIVEKDVDGKVVNEELEVIEDEDEGDIDYENQID